ncbi:MAG: DNA polymerase Y family protein [Rhodobacteraceae bacterium]|nr:DNA polymerase Y family protein [Paracoccaceae bacterium]
MPPKPRRILCLWLPRFASELSLRRAPVDGAFALVAMQASAERLVCLNGQAQAQGLARGMGLADARALCPDLLTRPFDAHGTGQGLMALARWAMRYCPLVARDGDDGLVLDITGAAHLLGGEAALLDDLLARMARMGLEARAAIAPSRGAAWALAHYGLRPAMVVPDGQAGAALARLPLAALRLPPDMADKLGRLGLRVIGDLHQIPRATLPRRFGPDLLLRLDQALGHVAEPVAPAPAPPHFAVRLSLPEPVGLIGDISAGLERLLDRLCDHLHRAEHGACRLRLELSRVDGQAVVLEIGLARPMRDAKAMAALFARALEGADAGFGIDAMRLSASATERLPVQQITTSGAQMQDDLADLLTRLCNRVGFDHVWRALPAQSHIPEKAFTIAAAAYSAPAPDWPDGTARPLTLFAPEPIVGQGRAVPRRFRWRGRWWRVRAAQGPERISPEWWLDDPAWRSGLRDYWCVQTEEGPRLWLFHTPQRDGWCVQGEFA